VKSSYFKPFTFGLLFLSHLLFAQSSSVNIPGTRLYITPPIGYKLSERFKGLEKNKDIFIKVYDPYNTNYLKYAQGFTRESLENGGSEVQDYKKLNISGFPAKYAALQNNVGGKSYYLVFGDSSFSVMVIASCPANKDTDQQQLKAALLSATYSKNIKTNPLTGIFFKINDSNSDYRFSECKNDYYIYSANGIVRDKYQGESIVSVQPFTSEYSVGDETIVRTILNAYEQYGITDAKLKKEVQVQIGTLNAMEAEINAKIENKKAVIYRLTLVNGKKAILFLGIATSNFEKNMNAFRTLANTIRFK
jgi:hypothetical protein